MTATGGRFDWLRQPEYTGENRCLPCTVVNTIIATVLAGAVAAGGRLLAEPVVGVAAGTGVLAVSLGAIYFRGYLVPGTPALTKQYLPQRVLAWFGKAPDNTTVDTDLDPERALVNAGALEPCADRDDLCLADGFRSEWYDEIDRLESANAGRERLLDVLGLTEGSVDFEDHGDAFRGRVNGSVVGRWESEAAFLADVAAAEELDERIANWGELSVRERSQLLSGLRIFIDSCPACGGRPEFGTDTVESCCSTHEVAAVSCDGCGARLFESRV
ncbi:hypothetical protein [Halovenus sp. HT40]|uniref:hypothetical protein n=1 Tax=Halovenus sp. HT40 TaxID=3126691 RepID=UPI00300F3B65